MPMQPSPRAETTSPWLPSGLGWMGSLMVRSSPILPDARVIGDAARCSPKHETDMKSILQSERREEPYPADLEPRGERLGAGQPFRDPAPIPGFARESRS